MVTSDICDQCSAKYNSSTWLTCKKCAHKFHGKCMVPPRDSARIHTVQSNEWMCGECVECLKCKSVGNEASLLICGMCDRGMHSECMETPLPPNVPGWICDRCTSDGYTFADVRAWQADQCEECKAKFSKASWLCCADCGTWFHGKCTDLDVRSMGDLAREWRCDDCKFCVVCKSGDEPEKLLLCDTCDRPFHLDCLKTPMTEIPEGDWACEDCSAAAQAAEAAEKTLVSKPPKKRLTKASASDDLPASLVGLGEKRKRTERTSIRDIDGIQESEEEAEGASSAPPSESDDDQEAKQPRRRSVAGDRAAQFRKKRAVPTVRKSPKVDDDRISDTEEVFTPSAAATKGRPSAVSRSTEGTPETKSFESPSVNPKINGNLVPNEEQIRQAAALRTAKRALSVSSIDVTSRPPPEKRAASGDVLDDLFGQMNSWHTEQKKVQTLVQKTPTSTIAAPAIIPPPRAKVAPMVAPSSAPAVAPKLTAMQKAGGAFRPQVSPSLPLQPPQQQQQQQMQQQQIPRPITNQAGFAPPRMPSQQSPYQPMPLPLQQQQQQQRQSNPYAPTPSAYAPPLSSSTSAYAPPPQPSFPPPQRAGFAPPPPPPSISPYAPTPRPSSTTGGILSPQQTLPRPISPAVSHASRPQPVSQSGGLTFASMNPSVRPSPTSLPNKPHLDAPPPPSVPINFSRPPPMQSPSSTPKTAQPPPPPAPLPSVVTVPVAGASLSDMLSSVLGTPSSTPMVKPLAPSAPAVPVVGSSLADLLPNLFKPAQ